MVKDGFHDRRGGTTLHIRQLLAISISMFPDLMYEWDFFLVLSSLSGTIFTAVPGYILGRGEYKHKKILIGELEDRSKLFVVP